MKSIAVASIDANTLMSEGGATSAFRHTEANGQADGTTHLYSPIKIGSQTQDTLCWRERRSTAKQTRRVGHLYKKGVGAVTPFGPRRGTFEDLMPEFEPHAGIYLQKTKNKKSRLPGSVGGRDSRRLLGGAIVNKTKYCW